MECAHDRAHDCAHFILMCLQTCPTLILFLRKNPPKNSTKCKYTKNLNLEFSGASGWYLFI